MTSNYRVVEIDKKWFRSDGKPNVSEELLETDDLDEAVECWYLGTHWYSHEFGEWCEFERTIAILGEDDECVLDTEFWGDDDVKELVREVTGRRDKLRTERMKPVVFLLDPDWPKDEPCIPTDRAMSLWDHGYAAVTIVESLLDEECSRYESFCTDTTWVTKISDARVGTIGLYQTADRELVLVDHSRELALSPAEEGPGVDFDSAATALLGSKGLADWRGSRELFDNVLSSGGSEAQLVAEATRSGITFHTELMGAAALEYCGRATDEGRTSEACST